MASSPGPLVPQGYLHRIADAQVTRALESVPIVVIDGVKGCGKTWTGLRHARSRVLLSENAAARQGAEVVPRRTLDGKRPRLIDEWQTVPGLWETARHVVDEGRDVGCFILTGSAQPADDVTLHSGAGRVSRVRMRPMSLAESGESDGSVSLGSLLDGGQCEAAASEMSVPDMAEVLCRGGWPRNLGRTSSASAELLESRRGCRLADQVVQTCRPRRTRFTCRQAGHHRHRSRLPTTRRRIGCPDNGPRTLSPDRGGIHRSISRQSIRQLPGRANCNITAESP
ncbi:AAA family ATPase [Candidatus Poriferisodalis sp.]|uniref:AAA family ATPase n=1 Tax=Candidatus Poriferisodalis sp. TaxID=3101277 RepID=UPI003B02B1B3